MSGRDGDPAGDGAEPGNPVEAEHVVVGLDGCRGGWAAVVAGRGSLSVRLVDDPAPLVAEVRAGTVAALAVDMPIGLLDGEPRHCDGLARRLLGPRHSTVFPTPVRSVLGAVDYDDACRRSRRATGKALSIQAFNLLAKIEQLDRLLTPEDGEVVVEAHPECAFARLAGEPLPTKHGADGRDRRAALLDRALGPRFEALRRLPPRHRHGVPLVDLLDAAVLTVTAHRVVSGTAITLGGQLDPTGKLARITY